VDPGKERYKAQLEDEVSRLRNPEYAPIKGPLPSPSRRMSELPSGMNQFTVPRASMQAQLRTTLMDDSINNQLKQRSRTTLLDRQRHINQPHPSYDIDGDGFISQADYQLAKRFDADGNGVIDKEEMDAGKRLIAKELWEKYRAQHFLQKPPITDMERQENVNYLISLKDKHGAFMRDYEKVKNKHWIEEQRGSAQVLSCVSKPCENHYAPSLPQHPVCTSVKPKTRSELYETRKKDYADSVNKRHSIGVNVFDDAAIFRTYNQRHSFVASDVNSYARTG